jgi:citrate lyase subunit beta / citryl-CoA lyase
MIFGTRSLLFVPGDRPDMFSKVARWRPDIAVVDLEDAVAPMEKARARRNAVSALASVDWGPTKVLVRVNARSSPWFAQDVDAVAKSAVDGILLPKYERPDDLITLRNSIPGGAIIAVGLETVQGVADSRSLLASGVDCAYFGAEDYIADIGGRRTASGHEVLYARSQVAVAARLAGIAAVDQAVTSIWDDEAFLRDAQAGRNIGYQGKICVHPRQVALAHRVFTPTEDEIRHALAVLEAAGNGVAVVDGEMVDQVHVRLAETTLARRDQA